MAGSIFTFDQLPLKNQSYAGGKGAILARLYQAGYPVPAGFILLPSAFNGDEISPEAWRQAQDRVERLRGDDPHAAFAVRSSALAEDSARTSFAGEFETRLDVRGNGALLVAIRAVRESRHSERVQVYSRGRGLEGEHEMAVIVQRMVPAEISGVLFTADPVTGDRGQMIGNYTHGLGEELVSGQVEAHEFRLSRPGGRYQGPPELKRFARRLFKLASRLERELGGPQDIEWAVARTGWRRQVFILQARPVTTLLGFDPLTGEFNDSLTGDYTWSSVNFGEAMSVVMTPLTSSVMRMAFTELDIVPGYTSLGNIGGRLYQNVTVMVSIMRALGQNVDDLSTEMGGVRREYLETMDQYIQPLPGVTLFSVLPNAIRVQMNQRKALKNVSALVAENPDVCRAMNQRIHEMETCQALVSFFRAEILPPVEKFVWATLATAWRYGESVAPLRRELTELVGAADADALLSNVSSQDELLASLGPLVGLAQVARGELGRSDYLERWGHRGPLETELSAPRPAEEPGWLDEQLERLGGAAAEVESSLAARRAEFEAAWLRLQERHPRAAEKMRRRLEGAAEASRAREMVRSESTRSLWVLRNWALRAGELSGLGEDVFFLTVDELLDLLAGGDALAATIPARRRTYERYVALPPYPLVIRGRFDPFLWAADPERTQTVFDSHGLLQTLAVKAPDERTILGTPGSTGRVEGVVRRLDDPAQGGVLQKGEVLVTSRTNIGWTLLFPRVGAIVTDVGAPLSHAAIVARELGIPAVVNCGDATTRLHTGDRVRVDGVRGVVEIMAERDQALRDR
jgi:pyruvate,water dikinase